MIPGRYMAKQCDTLNYKLIFYSTYQSNDKVRKRRKVLGGQKKKKMDKIKILTDHCMNLVDFNMIYSYYIKIF